MVTYMLDKLSKGASLRENWGWILATGITYLILGVIALSIPVVSTIGLSFALAVLLLIGGVIHLLHSFKLRHNRGGAVRYFQSAVAIVTGGGLIAFSFSARKPGHIENSSFNSSQTEGFG